MGSEKADPNQVRQRMRKRKTGKSNGQTNVQTNIEKHKQNIHMEQPQQQGLMIAHKPHMKVCHKRYMLFLYMPFILLESTIYMSIHLLIYLDVFVFCCFGSMSLRLSPVVSPSFDFLSEDWRTETMWKAVTWCGGQ